MAYSRRKVSESEANWLVSYADMMTLLVGFFVMLLSFSKIDATAFEKIKQETTRLFGGEYQIPFEKLSEHLKKLVEDEGLKDQVIFHQDERGIEISFRGALFFDSGSVDIKSKARGLLDKLIPTIHKQAVGFGIVVEGHTDDQAISGRTIATNWELSSIRSCTVLRLFEKAGFDPKRLKAIGWGDTRPLVPNRDPQGNALDANRAQNRRVVIKILKDFED